MKLNQSVGAIAATGAEMTPSVSLVGIPESNPEVFPVAPRDTEWPVTERSTSYPVKRREVSYEL
jgi:hypothetical protein